MRKVMLAMMFLIVFSAACAPTSPTVTKDPITLLLENSDSAKASSDTYTACAGNPRRPIGSYEDGSWSFDCNQMDVPTYLWTKEVMVGGKSLTLAVKFDPLTYRMPDQLIYRIYDSTGTKESSEFFFVIRDGSPEYSLTHWEDSDFIKHYKGGMSTFISDFKQLKFDFVDMYKRLDAYYLDHKGPDAPDWIPFMPTSEPLTDATHS